MHVVAAVDLLNDSVAALTLFGAFLSNPTMNASIVYSFLVGFTRFAEVKLDPAFGTIDCEALRTNILNPGIANAVMVDAVRRCTLCILLAMANEVISACFDK